ncbi:AP3-complex subunit beta-A-like [Chenopodium quinoa]|uniref:AP3-complex subunit beta-A-like n=1 Tax=Chenopodium quinoa TaxID=63459 RepID=UPI000B78B691|nr:AP3-complex subunit beta-A-like [Chenopodium quinoa]XP_021768999.1 AP3-complex subunit beta-A-like [Chenopodium quinoa]
MFPQFGATAESFSKASTMVFRIGTDAHLYDDPEDVSIAPLLDSKFDSEKCEALKRLLALIAQGFDVSNFFPQVVKNVASHSLEVKKLVYVYLLHYAEKRPNEALLSINCFQKDLGDTNPLVRAWALRTMAGIRLHVIAPLVLAAINKCARDPSVYVRRCAANALPKLNDLRLEENASAIEEIIGILLNDHSPGVVGAAAASFSSICPSNLPLIARNYKRLCEILPDVEEWGQIILIGILLRYVIARHGLAKESVLYSPCVTGTNSCEKVGPNADIHLLDSHDLSYGSCQPELVDLVARSYTEGSDEYLSRSNFEKRRLFNIDDVSLTSAVTNDDLKMLLKCTSPLLWSQNSAVVLAAAGVHWIMAPKDSVNKIVKPLLFVLRSSRASKYVVLCNIQVFAKVMPSLFADYYEDFFMSTSETYQIKALKLDILSLIATDSSIPCIFQEFQDYIKDPDRRFAADTVAAIGLCAQRLPKLSNICLEGLLSLTKMEFLTSENNALDEEAGILIQAVMSIKAIISQDPPSHEKVIIQLVRNLDSIKVPAARAIIIWMVGEYNSLGDRVPLMLTSLLRYLAHCFTTEATETKLQILNTATKVLLGAKGEDLDQLTIKKLVTYVLELAKNDTKYDVRDRARVLSKILSTFLGSHDNDVDYVSPKEEAVHLIAEKMFGLPKGSPLSEPISSRFYLPGSLSQIVFHAAPGYEPLPKPCSLLLADFDQDSDVLQGTEKSGDFYVTDDSERNSGSLDEGSASDFSSQYSDSASVSNYGSEESQTLSEADNNSGPLIQISDMDYSSKGQNSAETIHDPSGSGVEEILSRRALESWLGEQPVLSDLKSSGSDAIQVSARISIDDLSNRVKPKSYTLLDTVSGQGLKVDYSFSSQISDISPLLTCVEVTFHNCSDEPISEVMLVDQDPIRGPDVTEQEFMTAERSFAAQVDVPTLVPMEGIDSLGPSQIIKRVLQVRFHHHLLPLKLSLQCNGKNYPVKLRPDIGYFIKPLKMDVPEFRNKESQLPGMFEYVRRCTFADHIVELSKDKSDTYLTKDVYLIICESIALKMLSNANLFLVSVDFPLASKLDDASGLCLLFSAEILSSSVPCLITVTVEGSCSEPLNISVKVNCEETVFGLNLLNRVVNFLTESSPSSS